jgi:hypothetical protein
MGNFTYELILHSHNSVTSSYTQWCILNLINFPFPSVLRVEKLFKIVFYFLNGKKDDFKIFIMILSHSENFNCCGFERRDH